jgi:hypothetical protein
MSPLLGKPCRSPVELTPCIVYMILLYDQQRQERRRAAGLFSCLSVGAGPCAGPADGRPQGDASTEEHLSTTGELNGPGRAVRKLNGNLDRTLVMEYT